jgi:hypothetical protein
MGILPRPPQFLKVHDKEARPLALALSFTETIHANAVVRMERQEAQGGVTCVARRDIMKIRRLPV